MEGTDEGAGRLDQLPRAQEIVDFVWEIAPNPAFGTENVFEVGNGEVPVRYFENSMPWAVL